MPIIVGINGIKSVGSKAKQSKRIEELERKCAQCSAEAAITKTLLNCSTCSINAELNGE